MMAHTDRHFRYLIRLISKRVLLYTEMITSGAILNGDAHKHLQFNAAEHPVAIQLGGSNPAALARCARQAEDYGYDEINLNVGCPSHRVRSGRFGACLMLQPDTVASCIQAMQENCALPVTVKSRTGVDEQDSYDVLHQFIETVAAAGCRTFIIHARKAYLSGLSPRANRTIPALEYDKVYRLKKDFPALEIIINGGIRGLQQTKAHLQQVDGVMIGRAVCDNPWLLAEADQAIFAHTSLPQTSPITSPTVQRSQVIAEYMQYMQARLDQGERLPAMSRHLAGLYQGQPGARAFRRYLGEHANRRNSSMEAVGKAMAFVQAI